MTSLKKKILTRIIRKDKKNIDDFIARLKLFARKIDRFGESINSGLLRNSANRILSLEPEGVEAFSASLRELDEIQRVLAILRKREDAKQIDAFFEEIRLLIRPVTMAIWKMRAWDWTESIVIALFLALVIRAFVVQAFKIPTGSMRMTLIKGDLILVNKFIYGAKIPFTNLRLPALRPPKRGDVIVFIYPEDKSKDFIKRLVGFPGDVVEIKGGSIYINDQPASEAIFNQIYYYNGGQLGSPGQKMVVPLDSYLVLGDNSANSRDSRYWGFVPKNNLLGQAMVIYWPPQRIRIIK